MSVVTVITLYYPLLWNKWEESYYIEKNWEKSHITLEKFKWQRAILFCQKSQIWLASHRLPTPDIEWLLQLSFRCILSFILHFSLLGLFLTVSLALALYDSFFRYPFRCIIVNRSQWLLLALIYSRITDAQISLWNCNGYSKKKSEKLPILPRSGHSFPKDYT